MFLENTVNQKEKFGWIEVIAGSMFSGKTEELIRRLKRAKFANRGVRVIVAGLDMDFKGNPFGPMPALMATAEYVTKVHAVCTRTGNLANYSYRKAKSDELVLLGEVDEYEPLSRSAYYKLMLREKVRNINVKDAEDISKKKEA